MSIRRSAALAALLFSLPAAADLGPPDLTYGGGDGMIASCSSCYGGLIAFRALADGSTVAFTVDLGNAAPGFPFDDRILVARFLPDGSPDPSFGNGGQTALPVAPCCGSTGAALAIQSDGAVLVAWPQPYGPCTPGCTIAVAVARLRPNGNLDATFGNQGTVVTPHVGRIFGVKAAAGGKVLVAFAPLGDSAVIRLTASGELDPGYGVGGLATMGNAGTADMGALFLPDGRVVLAGRKGVMRLDPEGRPDVAFNGTGIRILLGAGEELVPESLALQGNRLLVAVRTSSASANHALLRLEATGSDDPTFGIAGRREYAGSYPTSIQVDAQQRIAQTFVADPFKPLLRRLTPAGDLDPTWTNGTLELGPEGNVSQLQLLPNSKGMVIMNNLIWRLGANALQSDYEFVLQQYRDFLSREGDAGGVAYWRGRLESGATSRDALAASFLESPEFRGRVAPVARLYFAYFLRVPDYGGLLHWVTFADANSLSAVSDAFAASPEFANRYGSTDNGGFVQLVYQNVLGRAPDPAGQAHWTSQLEDGAMSRGDVMLAFSEGGEFRASTGNETLVAITYAGMLRREADAGGFGFWVDYLDDGNSPRALIAGFLSAPEYRSRFAP